MRVEQKRYNQPLTGEHEKKIFENRFSKKLLLDDSCLMMMR